MNTQKYRLGLVSVSFRKYTAEEILQAMKDVGLRHIEWGSDIHAPCNDICKLRELATLQAEYGIQCSSYGTYFTLGETPIEELRNYMEAAKILETNILRLWCGNKNAEQMSQEEKKIFFAQCREAAHIAEEENVILCMECHYGTFTENCQDAVSLMQKINSPHFRMYWQPFQLQTYESNLRNANLIAPYAEHIHIFNWSGSERFPLDEAISQWQTYLNCFDGCRMLLLEFMPNDTLEELAKETESLRKIAGVNI